jgi:fructose-bisphosphate aldolase, class I
VAVDHGFFNEGSFLAGIEDLPRPIELLVEAAPDAIQLTVGQAPHLQRLPGRGTSPRSCSGPTSPMSTAPSCRDALFSRMIEDAALQAVRLDAACVVVNLFHPRPAEPRRPVHPEYPQAEAQCDHYGMPLMIEPLVFQPNDKAGGYMVDGDPEKIIPLVRQAVELGADIIKADPTDDVGVYHKVIETAGGIPVLVRGGGKAPEHEILARTVALMAQGASGIVYGRNIIQHPHPAGITRALMAVVHGRHPEARASRFPYERMVPPPASPCPRAVIGAGLMGREVASVFGRWFALVDFPVRPS